MSTATLPRPTGTYAIPEGLRVAGDAPRQPHERFFRIIDAEKGDERLVWDSRDFSEIQAARMAFIGLIEQGLKPFRVGSGGEATAEAMAEFDPTAEEVLFLETKLLAGG